VSVRPIPALTLNVVPVSFSSDTLEIGRVAYTDEDDYARLRGEHWQTHAFRFDTRSREILNVSIVEGVAPLGNLDQVFVGEHLLLAARAVQQSLLVWVARRLHVLRGNKQLVFWGQADEALLLSQAMTQAKLAPMPDLEVPLRYQIDCRMFQEISGASYLGIVIGVETANVIDIPVSTLMRHGLSPVGRYVCRRKEATAPYLHPALETLGRVSSVSGSRLLLTDSEGMTEVPADTALLEPRSENLQAAVQTLCGAKAPAVLSTLQQLRRPTATARGQLEQIKKTLTNLKHRRIVIANGVEVTLGDLLQEGHALFPSRVPTERPTLLFGPQGRNTGPFPDNGIKTWGPYMYMQHTRNSPLIAVVCEARYRGRVEQFVKSLCDGFPDELWPAGANENPFRSGLIGKFRLAKVQLEYEECAAPTAQAYRSAVKRLLERLPDLPDLALVQIKEDFKNLRGNDNPYYMTKATFMQAGVPVQAVRIEVIESPALSLAYTLNSIALATYAKLDGVPWIMSTLGPTTHELVIGIGAADVGSGRLGPRNRYVGITTVFQGDGRYLLWGLTREVLFDEYAAALLTSLRTVIRYVQIQNDWQPGDNVRLVCHVYKRLKDSEVDAIKTVVRELLNDQFEVKFAFLDLSWTHPYRLVDTAQRGVRRGTGVKGEGVPERGLCLQLDPRRALMQLTGPGDIKTGDQGLPKPLLVELHADSDFTDMTYLLRQIYHFTYTSWRSFFPATEPVTIKYSRLVAQLLGNLRAVDGWDSTVLSVGSLRDRRWFL